VEELKMEENSKWKSTTFIIGGVVGLLAGLVAAFFLVKRYENSPEDLKLTSKDGVKIGMGFASLLKIITESGSK
jgi:hypothetical protein